MRFIHTSDWHLGKRLYDYDLSDDQKHMMGIVKEQLAGTGAKALLLPGDIYDRSNSSNASVKLFNDFIGEVHKAGYLTFMVPGNHDSADKLSCYSQILSEGTYIATPFDGKLQKRTVEDEHGKLNIWLMPFVRPSDIRDAFPEEDFPNFDEAVKHLITSSDVDFGERNILLAHQYVDVLKGDIDLGGSDESVIVGGADRISPDVFKGFDYVALGHVHNVQNVGRSVGCDVWYSGTPIPYSVDEGSFDKYLLSVDIGAKGDVKVERIKVNPLRKVRKVQGDIDTIISASQDPEESPRDYVFVTLETTGLASTADATTRIKRAFPNTLTIQYVDDTSNVTVTDDVCTIEQKSEVQLFTEFFEAIHSGRKLSPKQEEILLQAVEMAMMKESEGSKEVKG